eukprot:8635376-Ditylum_brightwellii.AAC.1
MRPTMARAPPEPPTMLNTNKDTEYRHVDTQENKKKHDENSITKDYNIEQSKKKKATPEGWR